MRLRIGEAGDPAEVEDKVMVEASRFGILVAEVASANSPARRLSSTWESSRMRFPSFGSGSLAGDREMGKSSWTDGCGWASWTVFCPLTAARSLGACAGGFGVCAKTPDRGASPSRAAPVRRSNGVASLMAASFLRDYSTFFFTGNAIACTASMPGRSLKKLHNSWSNLGGALGPRSGPRVRGSSWKPLSL